MVSSSSFPSSCVVVLLLAVGAHCVISPVIPREGEQYMFNCGGNGNLQYFLMHQEGTALVPGLYTSLKIQVFENASVFFESISVKNEGTHLCIRGGNGLESQGFPTPLRVRSLPPEDLWEEVYKAKFVTGFLAALVIAALFVLGCLVHKYRWRPLSTDTEPIVSNSSYVNPAMVNDDTESGCSTKM